MAMSGGLCVVDGAGQWIWVVILSLSLLRLASLRVGKPATVSRGGRGTLEARQFLHQRREGPAAAGALFSICHVVSGGMGTTAGPSCIGFGEEGRERGIKFGMEGWCSACDTAAQRKYSQRSFQRGVVPCA